VVSSRLKAVIREIQYFAYHRSDKIKVLALLVATQCVPVVVYRRFGAAHHSHLLKAEAVDFFFRTAGL
jgi:hypothetical protein